MKIRNGLLLALIGVGMAIAALRPAAASTITYDVTFSAWDITGLTSALPAPFGAALGSFTVTLDPAVGVTNASTIALDFLTPITLGTSLLFDYFPALDTLAVGANGVVLSLTPGTDDIGIEIGGFTSGSPFIRILIYSNAGSPELFSTPNGLVHVQQVAVATTPIPAALPLLAAALGGLGCLGWRRRKSAAA